MEETSISLVNRAREGLEVARNDLATLYRPYIAHIAYSAGIRNKDDVDDIVQDTLLTVFEQLPDFTRIRTGSVRRWVTVIARRRISHFRNQREPAELGLQGDDSPQPFHLDNLSAVFDAKDILRVLWKVVSLEFSSAHLNIFERSVVLQQPTSEIASDLGVLPNVIHLTRSRIMKKLRETALEIYGIEFFG